MLSPEMTNIIHEINLLVTNESLNKGVRTKMLADKLWEFELLQMEFIYPERINLTLNLPFEEVVMITAMVEQKQSTIH